MNFRERGVFSDFEQRCLFESVLETLWPRFTATKPSVEQQPFGMCSIYSAILFVICLSCSSIV